MNNQDLIDGIVRQTSILIAHLATAAGSRAPVAHLFDQVFLSLSQALREQGVGSKVVADMFGMALRTYQGRVQRLAESATERDRSLWVVVLSHLQAHGLVSRANLFRRFSREDEAQLRAVLNDLVESGLVFRAGRGDATRYRAATAEDFDPDQQAETDAALVWVSLYRARQAEPGALARASGLSLARVEAALAALEAAGRIERAGEAWRCDACVIPLGVRGGWEAAVFDHFQAVVTGLCVKLRQGQTRAEAADATGGSTYGFDLWVGHPLEAEVLSLLGELR